MIIIIFLLLIVVAFIVMSVMLNGMAGLFVFIHEGKKGWRKGREQYKAKKAGRPLSKMERDNAEHAARRAAKRAQKKEKKS